MLASLSHPKGRLVGGGARRVFDAGSCGSLHPLKNLWTRVGGRGAALQYTGGTAGWRDVKKDSREKVTAGAPRAASEEHQEHPRSTRGEQHPRSIRVVARASPDRSKSVARASPEAPGGARCEVRTR